MDLYWPASSCSQSVYECINAIDRSKVVKIIRRQGYSYTFTMFIFNVLTYVMNYISNLQSRHFQVTRKSGFEPFVIPNLGQ
jgi:hypothetical protein